MSDPATIKQFMETTGAEENVAKFFIESSNGDVMRALDSFFESGGEMPGGDGNAAMHDADQDDSDEGVDEDEIERDAGAGQPGPATLDDLTSSLFKKAEQVKPEDLEREQKDPKRTIFKGKGFTLGKEAEAENEVHDTGPVRPAPKSYKVTVWKGNAFQVDDGEVRYPDRGPDQAKNKKFMEDLGRNIAPEEMQERDSSGLPIPVNISLSDHREDDPSNAKVVKPKFKAFGGGGNALGKDWTAEAFHKVSDAASAPAPSYSGGSGGIAASKEELASQLKQFEADAAAPDVTALQLRLPSGQRAEARLSAARTVGDLRRWVVASGHVAAGQNFFLSAGFPPQPLTDEAATLKDAALSNAAVIVRLA